MKPSNKVSANQYCSTSSGTIHATNETDNDNQMLCWQNGQLNQSQQQQTAGFVPSYDPEMVYTDPWEDYLQRREYEKNMKKQEEERLYFQYLDELRVQDHRRRKEYESSLLNTKCHHEQSYHVHHDKKKTQHQDLHQGTDEGHDGQRHEVHYDKNAFQPTAQWVDHMIQQQEANVGHWENPPGRVYELPHQHPSSFNTVDQKVYQMCKTIDPQESVADSTNSGNVGTKTFQLEEITKYASTSQQQPSCPDLPEPAEGQANDDGSNIGAGEGSGIAGALAQLHLGEAKSQEQEAYEEHMRRQCWETGNIDYMGRDSFDNIWKRIQQTINTGTGQYAEETSEPPVAQTTAPATTPRKSRRPSRSRSATPKRDPKDRSPTPQPEEKIPVDKKEAHVVLPPVIAEEDDIAISLSSMDSSILAIRRQNKLPPPIQYDPTTNTTTLTKQVFAGYQQIITTKSPDGKTRTHTKLVYDPSIEDDQAQEEKTEQLTASTVATNQDVADGTMIQKVKVNTPSVSSEQKSRTASTAGAVPKIASPKMVVPPTNPYPETNSGDNYSQSAIPKSSSKPAVPSIAQQPQQQVAQESLAGKTNAFFESKQPIKALRKKRHISPSPQPLQTANATSNDSTPGKAPSSSSSSSSAINALPHGVPSNQKAAITTPTCPSAVSPSSTASSSKADSRYTHNTLHSRAPLNNAKDESTLTLPSLEKTLTPSPQSSSLSKSSIEVGSPPVPPRRKRESRTAKLGKIK